MKKHGEEPPLPGIDLSHDQLFFLNFAQVVQLIGDQTDDLMIGLLGWWMGLYRMGEGMVNEGIGDKIEKFKKIYMYATVLCISVFLRYGVEHTDQNKLLIPSK